MQNKLQELTDKLYNEGLTKGKAQAEELKAKARTEAEQIIAQAKEEARQIISQARKEAQDLKSKTESDIKMSASKSLSAIRNGIESMLVSKMLKANVSQAVSNPKLIEELISTIASSFNSQSAQAVELDAILPEKMKEDINAYVKSSSSSLFNSGIDFKFSKDIDAGFQIGPKGENYMISFTDKDLENVISQYLRPITKNIIFGK